MCNYKSGFTLSEVLLVLSVIGVVAALTIPTLIQKISDDQYKVAWKKSFSTISQAVNMIASSNGGSLKSLCADSDNSCLRNLFISQLSAVKSCNSGSADGCWHIANNWRSLSGAGIVATTNPAIVLNDGSLLNIFWNKSDCTHSSGSLYRCGGVTVDVNGFKSPNVVGKDIFSIHLLENAARPYGTQGDAATNDPAVSCIQGSTDSANSGVGCAALYLYQ